MLTSLHITISDPTVRNNLYTFSSHDTELLEVRAKSHQNKGSKKHVPPPPPSVTFSKDNSKFSPKNHLDELRLHGKKREAVEKWHKNVVAEHMKTVKDAHSAEIMQVFFSRFIDLLFLMSINRNLAHSVGSKDPNIHISVQFKDKHGNIIETPQRGNGKLKPTAHVYVNKEDPEHGYKELPIEYRKAMDKHAIREGREPGHA